MAPAYTVFWMSGRSRGLRRFSVSGRQLAGLRVAAVAVAVGLLALGGHLLMVRHQAAEGHRQRAENLVLRARLHDLRGEVGRLEEQFERIDRMAARLRAITELQDPGRELSMDLGGSAGASEEVLYAREERIEEEDEALDSSVAQAMAAPPGGVGRLALRARQQQARVAQLAATFAGGLLEATPSVRPLASRLVARPFGPYIDPFTRHPRHHSGIDLAAEQGALVRATGAGRVVEVGPRADGLGRAVTIDHGFGLTTLFGHLGEVRVAPGARVRRGEAIGTVGNSGRSQGPHLHYEVRAGGAPQDPEAFFLD